jgi:hypothetical protein
VVKDGPSYLSGKVQPSDIVKAVDSVRVGRRHGYALDNVKKLILGLPDTTVTLRIVRGQQEFDVIITRSPPRTSTGASLLGRAKALVTGATPFAPAAAAAPHAAAAAGQGGPKLRRSISMPVQPAGTEQDVRLSGGQYSVQLDYQVPGACSKAVLLACAIGARPLPMPRPRACASHFICVAGRSSEESAG